MVLFSSQQPHRKYAEPLSPGGPLAVRAFPEFRADFGKRAAGIDLQYGLNCPEVKSYDLSTFFVVHQVIEPDDPLASQLEGKQPSPTLA